VCLGSGVRVLDGVVIGGGAVIGAGALATTDVPAYSVAVGVPARVIKYRVPDNEAKHRIPGLKVNATGLAAACAHGG